MNVDPGQVGVPDALIRKALGSERKRLFWLKSSGHLIPVGEERETVFAQAAAFIAETMRDAEPEGKANAI